MAVRGGTGGKFLAGTGGGARTAPLVTGWGAGGGGKEGCITFGGVSVRGGGGGGAGALLLGGGGGTLRAGTGGRERAASGGGALATTGGGSIGCCGAPIVVLLLPVLLQPESFELC